MSVSYYDGFKPPGQEGFWHFLNRILVVLIAFAVITLIVCAFLPALRKQREQVERQENLKKEYDIQKALLAQRTRMVSLLNNDPGYVEVLARDKLDKMKDNETIYRLESQATPTPPRSRRRSQ